MTQPIASRDPWTLDDATAPPWSPDPPPLQEVSEPPDAEGGLPAGAAVGPAPVLAAPPEATRETMLAQRLDAFMTLARPTFRTSDGDVSVAIPFHMNTPLYEQFALAVGHVATLAAAGRRVGMTDYAVALVTAGRGTPVQIASLTQELLDEGLLPADQTKALDQRVRTMMVDYGIGLDCAGYVQQALLAARGVTRAAAGLRAPLLEDLSGLAQRGYARVSLEEVRTGDLFIFRPPAPRPYDPNPVGHTAIVRDSHATTATELAWLTQTIGISPEAAANGGWTTFRFDSSWGSSGVATAGGVARRTLWHDAVNGTWIWTMDAGRIQSGRLAYGHEIDGIYRAKGK